MHTLRTGMAVVMWFMEDLTNNVLAGDEDTIALLSTRALWFIPLVNPDGYVQNYDVLSHKTGLDGGGGWQRKVE